MAALKQLFKNVKSSQLRMNGTKKHRKERGRRRKKEKKTSSTMHPNLTSDLWSRMTFIGEWLVLNCCVLFGHRLDNDLLMAKWAEHGVDRDAADRMAQLTLARKKHSSAVILKTY